MNLRTRRTPGRVGNRGFATQDASWETTPGKLTPSGSPLLAVVAVEIAGHVLATPTEWTELHGTLDGAR